jgi:phosphoserine phosphatase RsbU/P
MAMLLSSPGPHPTLVAAVTQSQLRWQVLTVAVGVVLVVIGLAAISLFFLRRKTRDLTLIFFGLFNIMYAARLLVDRNMTIVRSLFDATPRFWEFLIWDITCTILIPFGLFLYPLVGDQLRKFVRWMLTFQVAFSIFGIVAAPLGASIRLLHKVNNLVVLGTVLATLLFVLVRRPSLAKDDALGREIRVVIKGFLIWFAFIAYTNLADLNLLPAPGHDIEFLGFLTFVCCLGYVTASLAFAREERFLALNKELEIARQIQACTLPQSVPQMPGLQIAASYVPMSAVAGDFYDFIVVDEKHLGVLIADVTGHGVPAALIASMLKVAFAEQFHNAADPVRVLTGLNRSLCGKFEEHFVTAAYVFIDAEKDLMRYAGAGHPPLMLASRSSPDSRQVEENGVMLGLFPEAEYSAVEIQLHPDDRCLLYTDGAFEATNAALEEFGKLRLAQFLKTHIDLPPARFTAAFLGEISQWAGHATGRSRDDDITLLVLDYQNSGGSVGVAQ